MSTDSCIQQDITSVQVSLFPLIGKDGFQRIMDDMTSSDTVQ